VIGSEAVAATVATTLAFTPLLTPVIILFKKLARYDSTDSD